MTPTNWLDISSIGAGSTASGAPKAAKSGGTDGLANQDTFLKLLIAQIRNQNPLNPSDGLEFVSQLAQFSTLEQNLQIRDSLDQIRKVLEQRLPEATDPTNSTQGGA